VVLGTRSKRKGKSESISLGSTKEGGQFYEGRTHWGENRWGRKEGRYRATPANDKG